MSRVNGVIAWLALFFSLAGTGLAAGYVITSPSQIKPSVIRSIRAPDTQIFEALEDQQTVNQITNEQLTALEREPGLTKLCEAIQDAYTRTPTGLVDEVLNVLYSRGC
jgi:hypothetical protein